MIKETCYMCSRQATSREHSPPSCFFPDLKTYGKDLKKNLITVPACDEHNTNKSMDDEFFRAIIVMNLGLNEVGMSQFESKFLRAVNRNPQTYMSFFKESGSIAEGEAVVLQIDRVRLDKCINHLCRALFFYKFKKKLDFPINIYIPILAAGIKDGNIIEDELTKNMSDMLFAFLNGVAFLGENPDVFQYRIRYEVEQNAVAFWCKFYERFEFFAYSSDQVKE